jgi:FAD/FMN-containing dehydrogenase
MMAFAGEPTAAQAALAPFRALATPLADLVAPGPYSSLYVPHEERVAFSVRSRLIDHIGPDEARAIIAAVERCEAPFGFGEIRVLGGAFARVPTDATAFAHREARIMFSFIAASGNGEEAKRHDRWAEEGMRAFADGEDRVYVNFLTTDRAERIHAAYPAATWQRLRKIKRKYDPENLFRLNRNIPPL